MHKIQSCEQEVKIWTDLLIRCPLLVPLHLQHKYTQWSDVAHNNELYFFPTSTVNSLIPHTHVLDICHLNGMNKHMYNVILPRHQKATCNTSACLDGKWTGLSSTDVSNEQHFFAPDLTIEGKHERPWWKKVHVSFIQCGSEMMFPQFQLKEMELGNASLFSLSSFDHICSSKITFFSQSCDWLPTSQRPLIINSQSLLQDTQIQAVHCDYNIMYICIYVWGGKKGQMFIWAVLIKHGCDKVTIMYVLSRDTQSTSQVLEHMRNIFHFVVKAVEPLLLHFGRCGGCYLLTALQ